MTTVFLLDNVPLPVRANRQQHFPPAAAASGISWFPDGVLPFVTAVFIHQEKHSGIG